jgi:hypothetical protein
VRTSEVRRDLGTQRPQFGRGGPRLGLVEPAQLDLRGHPRSHLDGGAGRAGAYGRAEGGQRAHHRPVELDGNDDAGPDRAVGLAAAKVVRLQDDRAPTVDHRAGHRQHRGPVVLPPAVPGQHDTPVGDGQGLASQQAPQAAHRPSGRSHREARPKRGRGLVGEVQHLVDGLLGDGTEGSPPRQPPPQRDDGPGDRRRKYDDDDDSPHPVTRISAGHTPG